MAANVVEVYHAQNGKWYWRLVTGDEVDKDGNPVGGVLLEQLPKGRPDKGHKKLKGLLADIEERFPGLEVRGIGVDEPELKA